MKKILSFFMVVAMLTMCSVTGFAEKSTIEINNADELMAFAAAVNNGDYNDLSDTTVVLTDDIDLSGITWVPIGTTSNYFSGTFDGNNKTISNLALNLTVSGSYIGLFGVTVATIQNLNVSGTINVDGIKNISYCGGIAGASLSKITDCKSNFTVTSTSPANVYIIGAVCGGIAGYCQNGEISDCESTMNLTYIGNPYSCYNGGIVGNASGATISNCTSNGTVALSGMLLASNFGGISGLATQSDINYCTNNTVFNMSTACNSAKLGGISALADRTSFYKCKNLADATVTSTYYGGIAGQIYVTAGKTGNAVINNCYNVGNISCPLTITNHIGGIAGEASTGDILIKNCYSTGTITSNSYKGAIAGSLTPDNVTVANCYFTDTSSEKGVGVVSSTTTGLTANDIGIKKTITQMQSQETVEALNNGGDYVYTEGAYPAFGTNQANNSTKLYLSDLSVAATDISTAATMVIASYNNGMLVDIKTKQVEGHTMIKISNDIISMENANQVKVFLFDGLGNIIPLCESVNENI